MIARGEGSSVKFCLSFCFQHATRCVCFPREGMKRTMENRTHTLWRTAHASHFRLGEAHMLSVQEMWLHPRKRRCESGMCEPQDVMLADTASFCFSNRESLASFAYGTFKKPRQRNLGVCFWLYGWFLRFFLRCCIFLC